MKAIVVEQTGQPEVMQWQEIEPPVAADGQVVVRLKAAGVNPVDTYIRAGAQGYSPAVPYTPGLDGAGIIESVGPGVSGVTTGERVYLSGSVTGTYAQYVLCNATQVHHLPDCLSFAEGAGIYLAYTTAYAALFNRGRAVAGDRLLVHGASGAVGLATVQLARNAGLTVIGSAGSQAGRDLLAEQGALIVIDHHDETHYQQIMELTRESGVNLIIEMLADQNLGRDLEILSPGGRVVVVGNRGTVEINPRELMKREAEVCGMSVMNLSQEQKVAIQQALHPLLSIGELRPVIRAEVAMQDAAQAHQMVMQAGAVGKIVLLP